MKAVLGEVCRICEAAALRELHEFRTLARVTSDSKPWPAGGRLTVCTACGTMQKLADTRFLEEIGQVYDQYEIYHQGGGAEQPIFDPTTASGTPRSAKIMAHLVDTLRLPERGRVLDFGCGTGVALRTFAVARPHWDLFGLELNVKNLPALQQIPRFSALYTCPPVQIDQRFTLVMLIHSLEHVLDPVATLRELSGCVDKGGRLFVQVPDCGRTPYDLVVTDHLLHFTLDSLRLAGERAGYRTQSITDALLTKELSWIGQPSKTAAARLPDPREGIARARENLAWLEAQAAAAASLAEKSPHFGIFGSSISGTWLYGVLREQTQFFVDEDPGRIGRRHMGLPILSPGEVPADADVFVPLIPDFAQSVIKRLAHGPGRYHAPPRSRAAAGHGATRTAAEVR